MAYQYDQNPFNRASDYNAQAAQAALPSPQSTDRAAARLRSRLDTQGRANEQQMQDQYGRRGLVNSGAYDAARNLNRASTMSSYASGLADIEDDYEKQRQAGASILGNIGANEASIGKEQGQLGLGGYQTDAQTGLGYAGVAQDKYATDIGKEIAEGGQAIESRKADITENLGLGGLEQERYATDTQRALGEGNLAQQAHETDVQRELGLGGLAEQRYGTDTDAALKERGLDIQQGQADVEAELGRGGLELNRESEQNRTQAALVDSLNQFFQNMDLAGNTGDYAQYANQMNFLKNGIFQALGLGPTLNPEASPNF